MNSAFRRWNLVSQNSIQFFFVFWDFLADFFFLCGMVFSMALQNRFVLQCLSVVLQCLTVSSSGVSVV